jgi:antitoxin VapB
MEKAKLFMNGKSQAVRLPKKYRFNSDEVIIKECPGGVMLIDPKKSWDLFEKSIRGFSDDFMDEREPIKLQEREIKFP